MGPGVHFNGAAPGPLFRSLPTECTRIAIVELLTSSGTLIQHNQSKTLFIQRQYRFKRNVVVVVFGQATGAIHVSIVDLILPETPCFPFGAFRHSGQMHFLIRYSIYLSILIFPVIPSECLTSYLLCSRIRNRLGILEFVAAVTSSGAPLLERRGCSYLQSW